MVAVPTKWRMKIIRSYKELITLQSFEDRYNYLRLGAMVGDSTFGHARYLNQFLYKSKEWRSIRDEVIIRDGGCDLGIEGYEIYGQIVVHHINPLTLEDVEERNYDLIFNPNNLITTTPITHNAIHFGDDSILVQLLIDREPHDTTPWR